MKNKYEVRGNVTSIHISRKDGTIYETIIDTADLDKVKNLGYSWCVTNGAGTDFYVYSRAKVNGVKKNILLHRWIMDAPKGMDIDHISHDTLDNRRSNLRITSRQGNMQNRRAKNSRNRELLNIYWIEDKNMWRVVVNNKFIGYFKEIDDAKKARDIARTSMLPLAPEYKEGSLAIKRPAEKAFQSNKRSNIKNVYWSSDKNKWFVRFKRRGEHRYYGYYNDFEEAGRVANEVRNTLV